MKNKTKLLWIVMTLILMIGALTTAVFAVDAQSTASLNIDCFSLSLENAVFMNFKVSGENVEANNIKLLAWEKAPAAYEKGTEDACLNVTHVESDTGYAVFQYNDLAAKDMTKVIYVCAFAEVDGEAVYSEPAKFSIAMYAYLKKHAETPDTDLVALLDGMLAYGAQAQQYFNCNENFLATDAMGEVSVVGGTLPDGFSLGWYKAGGTVTLTANAPEAGYQFSHWANNAGESVSTNAVFEAPVAEGDQTYTAVYKELVVSQGLEFTSNNDGTCYVSDIGSCTDTDIVIPAISPDGDKVTSIGYRAFQNRMSLTSINIPASVTSIGYCAFYHCSSLTSINIPSSVTSIDDWAFCVCSSLKDVTFAKGSQLTRIGDSAFSDCSSLETVTFAEDSQLISIGNSTFSHCWSLTAVYIADIAAWCNISFGSSDANPLYYAGNLYLNGNLVTDLMIPASVTSIGESAFHGCESLTSVNIPAGVTSIGDSAFFDCSNLETVIFAEGSQCTSIGKDAFCACWSLTSIKIPASVTSIGSATFSHCENLTSITIPAGVTSIGEKAFFYCPSLTNVMVESGNAVYHSAGNCLIETTTKVLIAGCENSVIPADGSVTNIGDWAFSFCSNIKNITIPASVTSIGNGAFDSCSSLKTITFAEGSQCTSIGNEAFHDCSSLTSINIPAGVTGIGYQTFYNCSNLTNITIPANAKNIDNYAFDGCSSLEIVTFVEGSQCTSIGDWAFSRCTSLTSITIPADITSIGNDAFRVCSALKAVTFSEGSQCNNIGDRTFYDCSSLTSINIPASVTSIGNYAFYNCSSLTTVTFAEGSQLTSISKHAFSGCTSLMSINIPASVTSINDFVFHDCSSLTEIIYQGTVDEWQVISKDADWDYGTEAYTITCTDGTIAKDGTVTMN